MKTCDRIVYGSLALFNEYGERSMTTNHLSAHLGISPGNLYYHFRNKKDIIRSIFVLYERHLDAGFQLYKADDVTVNLLSGYFDTMFDTIWRFRFMYTNLTEILARDKELAGRYQQTQVKALRRSSAILAKLKMQGVLTIEDERIESLADTMRMIACFWIDYKETHSNNAVVTKAFLYEGLLRVLMLFKAYCAPTFYATLSALEAHYQQLLNQDSATEDSELSRDINFSLANQPM